MAHIKKRKIFDEIAQAFARADDAVICTVLRAAAAEIQALRTARDEYFRGWAMERKRVAKLAASTIRED